MINNVFIEPCLYGYIQRHNLVKRLQKAVQKIKQGNNAGVDLKKRSPHSKDIWQFRITKKYRAYAEKIGDTLTVYEIDDHQ